MYRADSGSLRGTLWDSDGSPLATGVFPARSSNGWQDMSFNAPVRVVPGRTYVASYFTPRTKYAFRPLRVLRRRGPEPWGRSRR